MPRPKKLPSGMVQRPGREGYYADFTIAGQRCRDFLAEDYDTACEILAELKARAYRQKHQLDPGNDYPLEKLRAAYLAHCRQQLKPGTVRCYTDWLDTILPALEVVNVRQITVGIILAYREQRLEEVCPRTVNGEVGALRTMLNWAVDPAKLIAANPLAGLKPLPHPDPKEGRALEVEEVRRLLDHSPQPWRDIWYAFLVTGLREEELVQLRFTPEFLDWESREIIVPAWVAKSGRERRIPMAQELYEILRKLEVGRRQRPPGRPRGMIRKERIRERYSQDHVFVNTMSTPFDVGSLLYQRLCWCLRRAGIERVTLRADGRELHHVDLHSLRKTFATQLIAQGVDPKTVQDLLGHSTLTLTLKVYAKVRTRNKRDAIEGLNYGVTEIDPKE